MKCKPWTLALIGAGLVSVPAVTQAEEKPSSVLTALTATTLSGYVDTSAQWNLGTGNHNVPSYAWGGSSKADGFNLNVVQLKLEKAVEASDVWAAGYKVDVLFGPDASAFGSQSAFGNGSTASMGDFAVKQAYVALHAPIGNGLDFKVGVWDTLIGYEVFESINNPNFTRSYGYTMEPTTHTGVQATYQFCDVVSASAGVANTFGSQINQRANTDGFNSESYKAYMGSLTFTCPTNMGFLSGSTLSAVAINGFNSASPTQGGGEADQTSLYVGATINTPITGFKIGGCYDYAGTDRRHGGHPTGYANATGVYASYQVTEKFSLNARGEYASSDYAATFSAKEVVEGTVTAQYDLWKNVLSRVEFRWDHSCDGSDAGSNPTPYGGNLPGGPGSKKNSFILLANVSYKF
jgi:Putative beta-barrel porin-2, OmpL-like. bbp2